jgi:hypothetical protein
MALGADNLKNDMMITGESSWRVSWVCGEG